MQRWVEWVHGSVWRPQMVFVVTILGAAYLYARVSAFGGHAVFAVGMGLLIAGLLNE